jgi:hypothetical protein
MISPEKNQRRWSATQLCSARCNHNYPIVVVGTEGGGKRARCLGCKELGPEGEDAEQARQSLLRAARYSRAV